MLAALLPRESEVHALLALMLLHDARRDARLGLDGVFVPLDQQERRRWRSDELLEGLAALRAAAACPGRGQYQVQAAIAAAHAVTPNGTDTPRHILAALYAELEWQLEGHPAISQEHPGSAPAAKIQAVSATSRCGFRAC